MTHLDVLVRGSRWFARQPAALQSALLDGGRLVTLAKGQWLHSEGDEHAGLWCVLEGMLRLEVAVGPDRSLMLDRAGPGTIAGQTARFGGGRRLVTVRASEKTSLLLISDAALQAIGSTHPTLWQALTELLYRQLERAVALAAETLSLPPRARLAARLVSALKSNRDTLGRIAISQADLGEMTGLSRKSVNGHLSRLEQEGIVRLGYSLIVVIDEPRLRDIAAQRTV